MSCSIKQIKKTTNKNGIIKFKIIIKEMCFPNPLLDETCFPSFWQHSCMATAFDESILLESES